MTATDYPQLGKADAAKYGPWAVIAGASDGTGEQFAHQLAALGLNVMLISRRETLLQSVAAEIRAAYGVKTKVLVQDLMAPDAGANILNASADLDVGLFVSNAGSGNAVNGQTIAGGFPDKPIELWRGMIAMNVNTVMETTFGFAQRLTARGSGGILLMGSMSALAGLPYLTVYAASKSFVMGLTEGLWGEFAAAGIKVDLLSVLAPLMDTGAYRRSTGENYDKAVGLILYKPEDVVRQALGALPHGPLLMFPLVAGPNNFEALTEERRKAVLAQVAGKEISARAPS